MESPSSAARVEEFGIIMVILLAAALVSPPEGLNLYIIQGIRKSVSEEAALKAGNPLGDSNPC